MARSFLMGQAREQVVQQARLMMETATATRVYTAEHIRPLLETTQRDFDDFNAESVPAFAAITLFANLKTSYPNYSYREATLNPTNPADRTTDWEADVVRMFRQDRTMKEFIGTRETATGTALFLAKPMKAVASCMPCRSVPSAAPPAMVRKYGPNNGFGWELNEIVAAQIVTVPMALPEAMAKEGLTKLVLWLLVVALVGLGLLNLALRIAIIRPVSHLAATADEVSKGNLEVPEIPVEGQDEVSTLAAAFNRMHRSMVKAIKMLEE
jgi:protein-histidine pros-kinase